MALVEEQKQETEPVLDQQETSAANLEAISAAVSAIGVAMADLSDAAENTNSDQWDVIKTAADAPAIEVEKIATKEAVHDETSVEVLVKEPNEPSAEPVQESTIEAPVVEQATLGKGNTEAPTVEQQEETSTGNVDEVSKVAAAIDAKEPTVDQLQAKEPEAKIEEVNAEVDSEHVEEPIMTTEESVVEFAITEPEIKVNPEDSAILVEETETDENIELGEVENQDRFPDNASNSDIVEIDECGDQYSDYLGGDMDELSLDSISTSDASSQKIKKRGRVMTGFRNIATGFKDITVGTGRNVSKTTKKAANVGSTTISKGADGVANAARSAATGTATGVKAVASGVRDTGVGFAKATAGSLTDVGTVSSRAVTGAKDVVVQGACVGVGLTVLGAQALGHGAQRTAGAITDGTVGVATSVASGVRTAGGAVIDGAKAAGGAVVEKTTNIVHSVGETIEEAVDAGKAGIRAVEQGIENAVMNTAASVQKNTVQALTIGLQMADSNLQVVPKAIAAKPADST